MCHHKAPHREWEPHPKNRTLYKDDIKVPETFEDDYKNRARAAAEAKMRIKDDITYDDLGLIQPEGGSEVGERSRPDSNKRKIPNPDILIRTGNTNRLSNFLLWQIAYTEIFFIKKFWPEFSKDDYKRILKKFRLLKRNFGSI